MGLSHRPRFYSLTSRRMLVRKSAVPTTSRQLLERVDDTRLDILRIYSLLKELWTVTLVPSENMFMLNFVHCKHRDDTETSNNMISLNLINLKGQSYRVLRTGFPQENPHAFCPAVIAYIASHNLRSFERWHCEFSSDILLLHFPHMRHPCKAPAFRRLIPKR